MGIAEAVDLVQSLDSILGLQGWMLAAGAISQFVYAKRWQTGVTLRSLDLGRRQGSTPTRGMLVEGATTAVIEMPQELGQLVICYDMWEHLWILQILSDRLLGLAEMVPSLVSNRGVDLGYSLGFPSEEHMVAVPVGGCDGVVDRRLQGRGALKEADELNPVRVDDVAILHVEDEVLRDDGNRGMFMLAQIKSMVTTMAGVCMTQMAKGFTISTSFVGINPQSLFFRSLSIISAGNSWFHLELPPCTVLNLGLKKDEENKKEVDGENHWSIPSLKSWNSRMLKEGPCFMYADIWDVPFNKERLVFSEVVSGSVLGGGIKDLPPDVAELHMSYLDGDGYKMIIPVEPKFSFMHDTIRVSVLVSRRDTNKLACIFDKWEFMIDKYDEEKEVLSEWVPGSVFQGGIKDLPPEYCYRMVLPVEREFNILNETVIVSVSGGQGGTNNMVCIFRKSEFGELKSELEPLGYDIERLPDISDICCLIGTERFSNRSGTKSH
ncbi:hypothetical protein NE237_020362 [Protea cynaroides]|uniref:Uncharacterized protein n=1 Tax=Protea cynaroides TaxID=273540 RepID=A0A9Q0K2I5_9MAGN|nr:hypothetical protein NE237_020362 [Protea cynaroides]